MRHERVVGCVFETDFKEIGVWKKPAVRGLPRALVQRQSGRIPAGWARTLPGLFFASPFFTVDGATQIRLLVPCHQIRLR